MEVSNQLITTIVSSVIAFVAILFIGWLISGTLVRRLLSLRQVTQAVENGELTRRVKVVGRDEIADVSASVNGMLDAIVRLLPLERHPPLPQIPYPSVRTVARRHRLQKLD